jgi:hypothetical protein
MSSSSKGVSASHGRGGGRGGGGSSQNRQKKRARAYKELVMGMSCADILSSAAWFGGTWLMPKEEDSSNSNDGVAYEPTYGVIGTQGTCTVQGFLGTLCIISAIYNACLALYYFLVIGKGWN